MHRLATEEQAAGGYWGEFTDNGPATGYDYITMNCVALYYEHSRDAGALQALRRSTDFHKYFTWPNGEPVETINGRNRYWGVSAWGTFAFSHWPDGRRYAEFLSQFFTAGNVNARDLGRLSQSALPTFTAFPGHGRGGHSTGLSLELGVEQHINLDNMRDRVDGNRDISTLITGNGWSVDNAVMWSGLLPNETGPRGTAVINQRQALRDFLALYALTRNDGISGNGTWDDLNQLMVNPGARTALFGDGTESNGLIQHVWIGGKNVKADGSPYLDQNGNPVRQNPYPNIRLVLDRFI